MYNNYWERGRKRSNGKGSKEGGGKKGMKGRRGERYTENTGTKASAVRGEEGSGRRRKVYHGQYKPRACYHGAHQNCTNKGLVSIS